LSHAGFLPGGRLARRLGSLDRGVLSVADQVLVAGGNFLTALVVAQAVAPADFGLFVMANTSMFLTIALQNGLLLQPLGVNGAALDAREFGRLLRANAVLQAGFAVATCLLFALVGWVWDAMAAIALPLTMATVLFQGQEFCRRVLYTRGRVGAALLNDAVNYDLQAVLLAVVGPVTGLVTVSVDRVFWLIGLTSLLATLIGVAQLRRLLAPHSDAVLPVARQSFEIGRWTGADAALSTISSWATPFIVTAVAGLPATAGLGAILQLLGPSRLLLRPVDSYYVPAATNALARDGVGELSRVLRRAALITAPPYLAYGLLLAVGAPAVLATLFGREYVAHAAALRIFVLASLVHFPVVVLGAEIHARRMQRVLLHVALCMVTLIYTLGLYLLAHFGLVGLGLTLVLINGIAVTVIGLAIARARLAERSGMARGRTPLAGPGPGLVAGSVERARTTGR
jgi:O-antigen/teichoic acid export membrane protein